MLFAPHPPHTLHDATEWREERHWLISEILITVGGTSQVNKRIGSYPRVRVEGGSQTVVSQAGVVLLAKTVRKAGLDRGDIDGAGTVATSAGGA